MEELSQKIEIYCNQVQAKVVCKLARGGEGIFRTDLYQCTRLGSGGKYCNPCSGYAAGRFVPVPEACFNEDALNI